MSVKFIERYYPGFSESELNNIIAEQVEFFVSRVDQQPKTANNGELPLDPYWYTYWEVLNRSTQLCGIWLCYKRGLKQDVESKVKRDLKMDKFNCRLLALLLEKAYEQTNDVSFANHYIYQTYH